MRSDNILENPEFKKAPFSVPEGYFDTLQERVASRVATTGKTGGRKISIGRLWPVAAAACLAAAAIGFWRYTASGPLSHEATADQEYLMEYLNVSDAQLADYGEAESQDTFTQDDIMEYLAYSDVSGAYIYDRMAEAE